MPEQTPEQEGFVVYQHESSRVQYLRRWKAGDPEECSAKSGTVACGPPVAIHLHVIKHWERRDTMQRRTLCALHLPGRESGTTLLKKNARKDAVQRLIATHQEEFDRLFQEEAAERVRQVTELAMASLDELVAGGAGE